MKDSATGREITELVTQNAASARRPTAWSSSSAIAATDKLMLNANMGLLDTKYTDTQSPAVSLNTEFSPRRTRPTISASSTTRTCQGRLVAGAFRRYLHGRVLACGDIRRCAKTRTACRATTSRATIGSSTRGWLTPRLIRATRSRLYGTNLTDEYELNSGFLHNIWQFDFATVDRPREVGVGVKMCFN